VRSNSSDLQQALALWRSGDAERAAMVCSAALARRPEDPEALALLADIHFNLRNYAAAIETWQRLLLVTPRDAAAQRRLANALLALGRFDEAATVLERSLALEPGNPRALNNLGQALIGLGRPSDAISHLEKATRAEPGYAIAFNSLGIALAQSGRQSEAMASYRRALALNPDLAEAEVNYGNLLRQAGQLEDALKAYDSALARRPGNAELLASRGNLLLDMWRPKEALDSFERALVLAPRHSSARVGRGHAFLRLARPAEALRAFDEQLADDPRHAEALRSRADALLALDRVTEALATTERAAQAEPRDANTQVVRGRVMLVLGRPQMALAAFDAAVNLQPTLAPAHEGRGLALGALRRTGEALQAFNASLASDPRNYAAFLGAGNHLLEVRRFQEALHAYDSALELRPGNGAARTGRALALNFLNRFEEAVTAFSGLLADFPDKEYLRGHRFHAQLHLCDWSEYDTARIDIAERVRRGERVDVPLKFMAHNDSPADQLTCAQIFASDLTASEPRLLTRAEPTARARIKIAYLSGDFNTHPVSHLAAGLFESHDRSRFETYAFSLGASDGSSMRHRLERAFDAFIGVEHSSDAEVAARIQDMGVDIAVDMGGYTLGGRVRILESRPAPVQVSYLGFSGTLGLDFIDYIIADRHVVPPPDQIYYTEQVIYLPDSYMPSDFARRSAPPPRRADAAMPEHAFVFCCFNNAFKLAPAVFDVWMSMLRSVPNGVLWLRQGSAAMERNLRAEAGRRGVGPERLIFAPRVATAEDHLARLALADLFLDNIPYNAHTTTNDALWAGVPVITVAGGTFAGRVATSLLNAVGLGQLSVSSLDEYRRLGVELADSPAKLAELRAQLESARAAAPLFDTRSYCAHLEAAYEEIWARSRRGERPTPLWVPRVPRRS